MERRELLTAFGTAVATAGCVAPTDGPDDATPGPGTRTGTGSRTETPAPEIPAPSDEFAGTACPAFTDADRTVCYHTAAGSDVLLAADPERFAPDPDDNTVEAIRFTLYNRSEWTVRVNPYDWAIHRADGSSWSRVAPEGPTNDPLSVIEPGGSLRWELPEMTHPSPGGSDTYRVDTPLSAGTYAFSVTGSYDGTARRETPSGAPPARTAFVALFRLDSPVGGGGRTRTATSGE